jgi:glycosyltransferase involved in cell wall biosynthesis
MDSRAPRSVLFVTPRWTRDGGVATHAMASAAALVARGVQVRVLARRADEPGLVPGVEVHLSESLLEPLASPAQRIGDALEHAPDVIHLHQFEDLDLARQLRSVAPLVLSVHGYSACTSGVHYFPGGHECDRAHGPGCVPNLLLRGCAHTRNPSWLPRAYRQASASVELLAMADLVISYSSAVDRHLARNGTSRRAVIPFFGTVPASAAEGPAVARRVIFAGRVVPPKGLAVLIRAIRDLDAELVVCGDGYAMAHTKRLVRRLSLDDRVSFRGWVAPEQLARELSDAAVLALPSLWPEPFGLVGIEAHALGRPVVASDTGGVRDWLEDGVSGRCVPPGDPSALAGALGEVLDDPARALLMGEAGRRSVRSRFTADRHIAALLVAYADARAGWEHASATPRPSSFAVS